MHTPEQIAQFASLPFDQIPADAIPQVMAYLQNKASAKKGNGISLKVSEKGAVSLYGMGRFPVTLYRGQWERLLSEDTVKTVREFIEANKARLAEKPAKAE